MTVYCALLHIPSGYFMPNPVASQKPTHISLEQIRSGDYSAPRLFKNFSAAKNSLRWWLQGKSYSKTIQNWEGEYDTIVETTPVADRIASEWSITSVRVEQSL